MGRASVFHTPSSAIRITTLTLVLFFTLGVQAIPAQTTPKSSVEMRAATVDRILADYHDEQSKREPERASLVGDRRYDDLISDFSVSAANGRVERGQTYIQRLSEIDLTGLPEKTRAAAEGLLNNLIDEQSGDRAKTWQMPLDQFFDLHAQLLALAEKLSFTDVKGYDDYIARLHKTPHAFSQIMTNIQLGADAGRTLPQAGVDKVLAQVQAIVAQPPEASPFAAPLKRFPAFMPAADRQRISAGLLDAISTDLIPSYQRIGRFVSARASSGIAPGLASTP